MKNPKHAVLINMIENRAGMALPAILAGKIIGWVKLLIIFIYHLVIR